ncbi:MAG TPA: aconitase family protein, partial [Xanthobacteraceae bacterium]
MLNTLKKLGVTEVPRPERFAIMLDHQSPASNVAIAETHADIRAAARELKVTDINDVGTGIMHVVMPEKGLILPGELIVMNESHTPTGGALGAAVIGVGQTDAAVAVALGETWLMVPETIRIELRGRLGPRVTAKDIALTLMNVLGYERKAVYKTIEIGGEALASIAMDSRFTLTNFCSDMGAKSAIIEPDAVSLGYVEARAQRPFTPVYSDRDCRYLETIEVDLGAIEPLVA